MERSTEETLIKCRPCIRSARARRGAALEGLHLQSVISTGDAGRSLARTGGARNQRFPGASVRQVVLWGSLALFAPPARVAEAPAAAPPVSGIEVLGQVTLSLILVVVLLLALAWALRRLSRLQPQGAASLRVLGGLSLGARERILLVEADDQRLLVGVSPGGLRTLLVLEPGQRADVRAAEQAFAGLPEAPQPLARRVR